MIQYTLHDSKQKTRPDKCTSNYSLCGTLCALTTALSPRIMNNSGGMTDKRDPCNNTMRCNEWRRLYWLDRSWNQHWLTQKWLDNGFVNYKNKSEVHLVTAERKKRDLLSTMILWVARVSCKVTDASLSKHGLDSETYEHRREML